MRKAQIQRAFNGTVARVSNVLLSRMRAVSEVWIELTRLRKQAGQLHRRMLTDLTAGAADPVVLLRLTVVAQGLEAVAQAFEDIAHALETIVVKET